MQPHGRIWQELTWSWAYSTGHPTSDQRLEAAAKTAWNRSQASHLTIRLRNRDGDRLGMDIQTQNRNFSFMTGSLPLVALSCASLQTHSLTHDQRSGAGHSILPVGNN
jgi:hypothetical protein